MSSTVALERPGLSCDDDLQSESLSSIEAKFHRLLQAEKQSPEFAELWADVDSYLTAAVAAERARI